MEGAKVEAVVEIRERPTGLTRNMVQCVEDFNIPAYFGHKVSRIYGRDRVEAVDIVKVDDGFNEIPETKISLECDTVLISAGLIPENELIEMAGAEIDRTTNKPVADKINMTSIPGLFVCGNSFEVYDTVDEVSKASELAGRMAAEYIRGVK